MYRSTCCDKEISSQDFILNRGLCDECMNSKIEKENSYSPEPDMDSVRADLLISTWRLQDEE